jgi:hypothetical protein
MHEASSVPAAAPLKLSLANNKDAPPRAWFHADGGPQQLSLRFIKLRLYQKTRDCHGRITLFHRKPKAI